MEIKYKNNNSSLTVYVYGELDEYSAQGARNILDKLLFDNLTSNKVIFDLSGVSFMDSTGIGLLIGRYKKLKQFNIPSYITGATVATEKVLELAGLYKIMPKS
ncbi:MAG: STAS domain-containing protein [Clostridiales bacterium]|nr:STAS domain-containing protein [Clostridiales bacterium]